MDERGNDEDTADEQSTVPPGPAIEVEEARIPTIRRAPREPTTQEIDEYNITSSFSILVSMLHCRQGKALASQESS